MNTTTVIARSCVQYIGRLTVRVAGLLVLSSLLVVGFAGPSMAVCEDEVQPVPPETGFVGTLVTPPVVPGEGDPLAGDDVGWMDTYGPSTKWNTCDLGKGPDLINHPTTKPYTSQGNLGMSFAVLPVVIADAMGEWVQADPFSWLAPVVSSIQNQIGAPDGAFIVLMPLSIIGFGVWVIWRAKKVMLHETASNAAAVLLILGVALALLQYPQRANDFFQSGLDTGVELAQSTFTDDDFADVMFTEVMYRNWLAGELGDPDRQTAAEYGPALYAAQHITYVELQAAEAEQAKTDQATQENANTDGETTPVGDNPWSPDDEDATDADGDGLPDEVTWGGTELSENEDGTWAPTSTALGVLSEAKSKEFAELAGEIKDADPAAYAVLTGQDGAESRLGLAAQTAAFTWTASLFYDLAMFMLGLAALMIWAFIIAFPLVAIVGIHPMWRPKLMGVVNLVTAALVAGFKFLLAAAIYSAFAQGILQAEGVSGIVKWLLLLAMSIGGLMLLRPFKTLKTFIPGADPNNSMVGTGVKRALDYALDRKAHDNGPGKGADANDKHPAKAGDVAPVVVHAEEEPLPTLALATAGASPRRGDRSHGGQYDDASTLETRPIAVHGEPSFRTQGSGHTATFEGSRMASPNDPGWVSGHEHDDFTRTRVPVEQTVGPDGEDVFVIYQTHQHA